MSTKPKAARFFLRRVERPAPPPDSSSDELPFVDEDNGFGDMDFRRQAPAQGQRPTATAQADQAAIAAISAEGLTGRQLRRARLMAQNQGLDVSSDLDAVLQLRRAGIDPFAQEVEEGPPTGATGVPHLSAVPGTQGSPAGAGGQGHGLPGDRVQLPVKARPIQPPSTESRAQTTQIAEVQRIQQDIARRRRRRLALLFTRLFVFVLLPTICAGWYFYRIATPIYATHTEFVIQSSEPQAAGGIGGLFAGTGFATSQDANAVQGYLQSAQALLRLEEDLGFRAHFQNSDIDALQRLAPDASQSTAYSAYQRYVKISHDPSEGIIKMEVMAADPETAAAWAEQLIKYAEERVDQLTQRMRENQMKDAQTGYDDAQINLAAAQRRLVELQQKFNVLSSETEVSLIATQIAGLDALLTQEKLSLAQMEANANPNEARMDPVKQRIVALEAEIAELRARMTEGANGESSLAQVQSELLVAMADVETRQIILTQSLQAMEMARIEVGRQTRYLSVSVSPTPPDEPAYPKAFENTLVTLLIMLGIYLMVSMTAAILREQVSS